MEILFIGIVLGVILLALICVIIAVVYTLKNRRKSNNMTSQSTTATVNKTYQRNPNDRSVGNFDNVGEEQFFAEFRLPSNSTLCFAIKKSLFLKLSDGLKGTLTYKGNDLLDFDIDPYKTNGSEQAPDYFFQKTGEIPRGKTVKFYAFAPTINIEMASEDYIHCHVDEICLFVDKLYDNTEDNFFVLEDSDENCLQFFNDGNSQTIEFYIPKPGENGSFKGEFSNLNDVKSCIKSFFNGADISLNYPVTFEKL